MSSRTTIMDQTMERFLLQAEKEGRFSAQPSEYYIFSQQKHVVKHEVQVDPIRNGLSAGVVGAQSEKLGLLAQQIDYKAGQGCPLRCVLQRKRPQHRSGRPDALPFRSAEAMRAVFRELDLPSAYFEIADGSPATAQSYTFKTQSQNPLRFELIAHCVTKQGDWAMALAHSALNGSTTVFWSLDERIDSSRLTEDLIAFPQHAVHPMLIPCSMFAATLRMAVERRHAIKDRLQLLEDAIPRLGRTASAISQPVDDETDKKNLASKSLHDFDRLFSLLHACRKDQASRKGRYDFWQSFRDVLENGFLYFESVLEKHPDDERFQTNAELKQWYDITWQRIESLMARDKDHIDRVENVSQTLYSLIQQREIRLQSSIARAAQQDSEGMKYIAVLGSIFLPASLIATILNVPEFQFARGATLFGIYMAITIPFSAIVVVLCLSRPYWTKWRQRRPLTNIREDMARKRTSTGMA
ncbi:hypothetical protein DOTSEDRAFT_24310 [Dothistroma septosporum NZE10]|uniref:Uncharacterized protein n=1 Tax=Dothistroma septosporum (strain NZE10 / CBS 128990) TaxID=675120 RepID=N1PMU3_DOTSN|nr:hypothetical protein DOTSEDRAFT_24310 [Dothistroma septosporum NZE10]